MESLFTQHSDYVYTNIKVADSVIKALTYGLQQKLVVGMHGKVNTLPFKENQF